MDRRRFAPFALSALAALLTLPSQAARTVPVSTTHKPYDVKVIAVAGTARDGLASDTSPAIIHVLVTDPATGLGIDTLPTSTSGLPDGWQLLTLGSPNGGVPFLHLSPRNLLSLGGGVYRIDASLTGGHAFPPIVGTWSAGEYGVGVGFDVTTTPILNTGRTASAFQIVVGHGHGLATLRIP